MTFLPKNFKFIDLFAGIGGFHYAMNKISENAECVFASEINANAIKLYEINFKQSSDNDITQIKPEEVKNFDVLCAGFPCQPFSKAGSQNGFHDTRGTLFFNIIKIVEGKIKQGFKPKLLILENVRNLASHDNYKTWKVIRENLVDLGYNTLDNPLILSPTDFDIPQLRDRSIILAIDNNIFDGVIDFKPTVISKKNRTKTIFSVIDESNNFLSEYHISDYQKMVLKVWNEFIKIIGPKTIGFPIWSDEFYSEYNLNDLPDWKRVFVEKNRNLYKAHKFEIDQWYKKYRVNELVKTHRKFEWQAGNHISSIYEGIIQFRPSGVRVKKPDDSPTLVAMAHIPILGKYQRYIAPNEAVKLQSFPESFKFETVGNDIYRMLGNAVNVDVIYTVTKQFIEYIEKQLGGGFNEKN